MPAVTTTTLSWDSKAERAATLAQQAIEARHKRWQGRARVRTFTAGQWFQLAGSDLQALDATVVGPDGLTQASGAEEIHMDRLGRIRIRFDFQTLTQGPHTSSASSWVRVLQRWAGAAMG
ncbi:hypothetical protein, partial [Pseudorhodoferax sp. Leaf267]|uniref:hypothetical protein n=1 Tax=Pseudorhodoferax sp. Leaf267 TaxID=1736316 RepID=UPI0006F8ED93